MLVDLTSHIRVDLHDNGHFNISIAETGELIGYVHEIVVARTPDSCTRRIAFSTRVQGTDAHDRAVSALTKSGFVIEYRP